MKFDVIIRVVVKFLIPFMLLFALYVQLHGDYGPGGGFQAGVIAAGAVIVYALVFGLDAAQQIVPRRLVEVLVRSASSSTPAPASSGSSRARTSSTTRCWLPMPPTVAKPGFCSSRWAS